MQLPLQIIQIGSDKVDRTGNTLDISSGGVCFLSADRVEIGGRIEYVITLSGNDPPVKIRCLGKVLRIYRTDEIEEIPFEVAVTMERYQFMSPQEPQTLAAAS